jgi:exonuclease SbcD
MTTIAFCADLHVDVYGQKVVPSTGLNARLADYLATLRWMAEKSAAEAEALVVAGDFTERGHPAPWLVSLIRAGLSYGPERQVYLRGNHDREIAGGSIVSILDDGTESYTDEGARIGISRPRLVSIEEDVVLACIPFLDRHWLRAQSGMEHVADDEIFGILSEQIVTISAGLYAEAKRDYPDAGVVLVLHQTLAGAHMSETQQAFLGDRGTVVDAARLAGIGFEGIVAGHLHRHQVLGGLPCPVVIPGSIERVDFGEEREAKGFVLADVGPGRFAWRFVETPARRFVTLDLAQHETWQLTVDLHDAIVRAINVPPEIDSATFRRNLEAEGAFEVAEIRRRPMVIPELAGGLSEAMSPSDALEEFFRGDDDEPALIEQGRRLLAEVVT